MPVDKLEVSYPVTLVELRNALKEAESPKIRERLQIIIHVKSGLSARKTAELMGISRGKVSYWVKRFNTAGFEGLRDKPRKGGEPKVDPGVLKEILEKEPKEFGYGVEAWTASLFRVHIAKTLGVEYHPNYIYQLIKRLGYALKVPRPESVKRSSDRERETFKKRF